MFTVIVMSVSLITTHYNHLENRGNVESIKKTNVRMVDFIFQSTDHAINELPHSVCACYRTLKWKVIYVQVWNITCKFIHVACYVNIILYCILVMPFDVHLGL